MFALFPYYIFFSQDKTFITCVHYKKIKNYIQYSSKVPLVLYSYEIHW